MNSGDRPWDRYPSSRIQYHFTQFLTPSFARDVLNAPGLGHSSAFRFRDDAVTFDPAHSTDCWTTSASKHHPQIGVLYGCCWRYFQPRIFQVRISSRIPFIRIRNGRSAAPARGLFQTLRVREWRTVSIHAVCCGLQTRRLQRLFMLAQRSQYRPSRQPRIALAGAIR